MFLRWNSNSIRCCCRISTYCWRYLRVLLNSTCFVNVAQNSKMESFQKIVVTIDEWNNLLNNPFFFVKPCDNNTSYKVSENCPNQLYLTAIFWHYSCLSLIPILIIAIIPLEFSKSSSKWIQWLIPCKETSSYY